MRFAFADPPYLGCCGLYDHRHEEPYGCWDDLATHQLLIERLEDEYPDGWALSCSMPSSRQIWPLTPPDTRMAPWIKPFCTFKKGVRPAYAWEPVLYRGGRNPPAFKHPPPEKGGAQTTPKDYIIANITLQRGLTGAKPERFCRAVLDWLGYIDGEDILDDLFPGTAVMGHVAAQGVLA